MSMCSCGRVEAEPGCDLCAYCRDEYERREDETHSRDLGATILDEHADDLQELCEERACQDTKWGEQNHGPLIWLPILTEEVGEIAKEILERQFREDKSTGHLRAELVQVAAVALAWVECLDRKSNGVSPDGQGEGTEEAFVIRRSRKDSR